VYVNDNAAPNNSISAFEVGAAGTLTLLPGSPFLTGGSGGFSQDVGAVDIVVAGQRLYATNAITNTVAAFDINSDGSLTTIPGSPFPTLGTRPVGIAINSAGTRLFAADFVSNNVAVFDIASNGALTLVLAAPFAVAAGPLDLEIDSANSLLFASHNGGSVGVYTIAGSGSLSPIIGSPFLAAGGERGLDVNAAATRLYVADSTVNTVSGFNIGGGGTLTAVAGSPFAAGTEPTGVLFHPSLDVLYVSNDMSNDVSAYTITPATGTLTPLGGSPFSAGSNGTAGMVIDSKSNRLFAVNGGSNPSPGRSVSVFDIGAGGALTAVAGSPFSTGMASGSPVSVTLVKACGDAPLTGCRTAAKTSLFIKQTSPDSKDRLMWGWRYGQPTTQEEFGNPFVTRTYALCLYDGNGLVLSAKVSGDGICDGKPCWSLIKTTGSKYRDKLAASDGMTGIVQKGRTETKSSIRVKGKGDELSDPALPLSGTVTAQFVNTSSGVCFEAVYSGAQITKNRSDQFRAKTP
jgi:6-phosphogluconolactonase (cycloisomerase 2 family)